MVQVESQSEKDETEVIQSVKGFPAQEKRDIADNIEANVILIGDLSAKQMASSKKGDKKSDKSMQHGTHNSGQIGRFAGNLRQTGLLIGMITH